MMKTAEQFVALVSQVYDKTLEPVHANAQHVRYEAQMLDGSFLEAVLRPRGGRIEITCADFSSVCLHFGGQSQRRDKQPEFRVRTAASMATHDDAAALRRALELLDLYAYDLY